ncbi:MAG: hypothetical protein CMJ77_01940 [Planctomycetaceae bacterium]|nr:hypothetical protein [Planctomycetaceae bacterium]
MLQRTALAGSQLAVRFEYGTSRPSSSNLLRSYGDWFLHLRSIYDFKSNVAQQCWKWLDGKNSYEIVVPKDAPANRFWSITAYDNDSRCII